MPIKKEILYPVFLECVQCSEDTFWKNTFEDLAYGKPPYGTYISKNFLTCGYKDKEFSYKIERKNPDILYKDIYKLLTKRLGILSNKEKIRKKVEFYKYERQLKNSRYTWKSIMKKNIKDVLIERYVLKKKKEFNLSSKQSKFLLSLIIISMIFKAITNSDIEYSNGEITNINGIKFTDKHIVIKRNIYKNNICITEENDNKKKYMIDYWPKFLKNLNILN